MTNTRKTRRSAQKYSDYTTATQAFMNAVESHLKAKFGTIEPQWDGLLNMLATTYDLYLNCKEKIKEEGLLITNRFGSLEKNPLLKVQVDAQIQCLKMVAEFGLSPRSIKSLNLQDNNEDEFLDELVK